MKNKIIILLSLLLLTGCTVNYNLEINKDTLNETITGTVTKEESSQESNATGLSTVYSIINEDQKPVYNKEELYQKELKESGNNINYTFKYNYNIEDFVNSTIINTCFENKEIEEIDNYYSIRLSGNFYCLYSKKINIAVTSNLKVASNNADKIKDTFNTPATYSQLRKTARKNFEERLNWNRWLDKSNKIIERLASEHQPDFYLPVYVINMKERVERKQHIIKEFDNKEEFELNLVEASVHPIGAVGLWNSMIKIIKMAKEKGEDIIVICEDDHYFTENYSPKLLFKEVTEAYIQGAEVLSGGIGGFGQAIPAGYHRYKVDWFWCTQFIVVYNRFFDKMLDYSFQNTDTADGVISKLATNKMVIYPFISEQKDFGYSDVTQSNMEQQGKIREHFARANKQMKLISLK